MIGDMPLAQVVASLFRDCPPHKPRGTLLWPGKRNFLLADQPLSAYFASVAEADSWNEEVASLRRHRGAGAPGSAVNVFAIAAMIPIWRYWGAILADAGEVPDLEKAFIPPGGYR